MGIAAILIASLLAPLGSHAPPPTPVPAPVAHHAPAVVVHHAPAVHKAAPKPKPKPRPKPSRYEMWDAVTPSNIPHNVPAAVYSTGGYAASPSTVGHHPRVVWIDTNGSNPNASALDVEQGDATPSGAAQWAHARLHAHPDAVARIYLPMGLWPATRAAIHTLPPKMQSHIRWWVADPTGYPHVVRGADATQWYWGQGVDKSLVTPHF